MINDDINVMFIVNVFKCEILIKVWYNIWSEVDYMNEFKMNKPVITLTQFLKATDYISSGGEAKYFLTEYTVLINDILEDRRGKKLYPGDIIVVSNDSYILSYDQTD